MFILTYHLALERPLPHSQQQQSRHCT